MTLQELFQIIPTSNWNTGKAKQPQARDAFENLYQLTHTLEKWKNNQNNGLTQEDQKRLSALHTIVHSLTIILRRDPNRLKRNEYQQAVSALEDGTLEKELAWVQNGIANGSFAFQDAGLKAEIEENLKRTGAALSMNTLTVPEEYKDNAKAIENGIRQAKQTVIQHNQQIRNEQAAARQAFVQSIKDDGLWDYPEGTTPTALQYLDHLKAKMSGPEFLTMPEDQQRRYVTAVFAARQAVDSKQGDKASLEHPLSFEAFMSDYKRFLENEPLQELIKAGNGQVFQEQMKKGHGGALEQVIKNINVEDYVFDSKMPSRLLPTALERIEYMMKNIREFDPDIGDEFFRNKIACIFAARTAVRAGRGSKSDLDKPLFASEANDIRRELFESETFKAFLQDPATGGKVKDLCSKRGHGGAMEDLYKEFLAKYPTLPTDEFSSRYMPTVKQRTEALRNIAKAPSFASKTPQEKKQIYIEVMAARMAAQTRRNNKDDLKQQISMNEYKKALKELSESKFLDQVLDQAMANGDLPKKIIEGHGGALEELVIRKVNAEAKGKRAVPDIPDRYIKSMFYEQQDPDVFAKSTSAKTMLDRVREAAADVTYTMDAVQGKESVSQLAAETIYLTVKLNENNFKNIDINYDDMEKEVEHLQGQRAFQKMIEDNGIHRMAQLIQNGGSHVVKAYQDAEKSLNAPKAENGREEIYRKDSNSINNSNEENKEDEPLIPNM